MFGWYRWGKCRICVIFISKRRATSYKNANTIEKIVPLPATTTLNELSTCSSGYLTRKIKRDCLVTRNIQSSRWFLAKAVWF